MIETVSTFTLSSQPTVVNSALAILMVCTLLRAERCGRFPDCVFWLLCALDFRVGALCELNMSQSFGEDESKGDP